jgi:hypothetical protein
MVFTISPGARFGYYRLFLGTPANQAWTKKESITHCGSLVILIAGPIGVTVGIQVKGSPSDVETTIDGSLEISKYPFGSSPLCSCWRVRELA